MQQQSSPDEASDLDLADVISQLGAGMAATHRVLLDLVFRFDERRAWKEDGATSMADWLCTRLGLRYPTALEWVRVAHALRQLPHCARAFAEGRLCWDQVRHLSEIATEESDVEMAAWACGASAAALEAAARRARRVSREEVERQQRQRYVRWWWPRDGSFRLLGRLSTADGAVVAAALERVAEQLPSDRCPNGMEHFASLCADALVGLASTRLADDADADRACVVVHVDAAALAAGDREAGGEQGAEPGAAQLDEGQPLNLEVARRLACDARLEVVSARAEGCTVGVGRTRRTIPPWLLRQLRRRDLCCRFPGCGRRRWLHGHHLRHWAEGGPTDLNNLILICNSHHHLVHELGWKVAGDGNRIVGFRRPDGKVLSTGPPGLRPEVRRRLARAIRAPVPLTA